MTDGIDVMEYFYFEMLRQLLKRSGNSVTGKQRA